MFNLTQWRWPAHPEKLERLHCYAASRTSHHLPAYRCAFAITCAQHTLKAVLVAFAGMLIQIDMRLLLECLSLNTDLIA